MPPHPVPDRPHLRDDGLSPLVSRRPLDAAVLVTDPLDALTAALAPIFGIVVHALLLSFDRRFAASNEIERGNMRVNRKIASLKQQQYMHKVFPWTRLDLSAPFRFGAALRVAG